MIIFISCLAIVAMLAIALEEVIHINKAKSTLFLGCSAWIALFISAKYTNTAEHTASALNENLLEVASLWLFLMATMTFVAYLNARGLISGLVLRVLPNKATIRSLTIFVTVFSIVLSMLCDNITAILVAIGVVQSFKLSQEEKVRLSVLSVFAVNSGGVILITGDVTTLMIFSAGHVKISELLTLVTPSLVGVLALTLLFLFYKNNEVTAHAESMDIRKLDIIIAALFFTTIISSMGLNIAYAIPPVLSFLTGLSIMFMLGGIVNHFDHNIHLMEYIRQIQFDTLLFFLGILLIVGALKEVGVLIWLTEFYLSINPNYSNALMGILSSLLDNVPLTAALLKAEPELNTKQWLSLVYAVGVGGSILAIGSAAGIVAMSRVKELTFFSYIKYAPFLLIAYLVGYSIALI